MTLSSVLDVRYHTPVVITVCSLSLYVTSLMMKSFVHRALSHAFPEHSGIRNSEEYALHDGWTCFLFGVANHWAFCNAGLLLYGDLNSNPLRSPCPHPHISLYVCQIRADELDKDSLVMDLGDSDSSNLRHTYEEARDILSNLPCGFCRPFLCRVPAKYFNAFCDFELFCSAFIVFTLSCLTCSIRSDYSGPPTIGVASVADPALSPFSRQNHDNKQRL